MTNPRTRAPGPTRLNIRPFTGMLKQSLSAGDTDDDGRNVLWVDEGVEVSRAGDIEKMNAATRGRRYNSYEKKQMLFHDWLFCEITS